MFHHRPGPRPAQQTPGDGTQRVELFGHPLDSRLQLIRGHLPWSKDHVRPRIVFRPVTGENSAFLLQLAKDGRARKRSETPNRGNVHSRLLQKRQRAFENGDVIVVKAEHQTGLDGNSGVMEFLYAIQVVLGFVEGFARLPQARRGDGFQADEQSLATAGGGEMDEILVIHDVEGGLAGPPLAQGNQATKEFAGVVNVADDIVVPEDQRFFLERGGFRNHLFARAGSDNGDGKSEAACNNHKHWGNCAWR